MFLHVPFRTQYVFRYKFHKIFWSRSSATTVEDKTNIGLLTISDVCTRLTKPNNLHLVPQNYVKHAADGTVQIFQSALRHLRWMIQKDSLKQDMYLLGGPGPFRRQLVMQFLELTQRELEYVSLSRDTTESDIKQRREIKKKNVIYHNQGAVRAALHGRVLVLDGIEHVESNVLPVLNNLLENREMHLESGQFLMAPERYDKLLETHSQQKLTEWGILRVSEHFRVIALGLPVHKYKGTPLDPPLRSRFQSRHINPSSFSEMYEELQQLTPTILDSSLKQLLSFALTLQEIDAALQLPDFPFNKLNLGVLMMKSNPRLTPPEILRTMYPYQSMLKPEQQNRIDDLLSDMRSDSQHQYVKCIKSDSHKNGFIDIHIDKLQLRIPCGSATSTDVQFVDLPHQRLVLSSLLQAFAVGDVCLLGEKGVGKLTLVKQLLHLVRQSAEPIMVYEDMTSRDLIQQRITDADGDTIWQDSPLVCAAKNGTVAILNGLHRLHKSTATLLQRIIHDRELQLLDGTMLLGSDRYQSLLRQGLSERKLKEQGVLPIHNSFRIVALAEPPNSHIGESSWLSPEILSLFLFEEVRPLQRSEEEMLLQQICGQVQPEMQQLLTLAQFLRSSEDLSIQGLAKILSTRQLIKIGRRLTAYPASNLSDIHEILQNIFMVKFMSAPMRATLEQALIQVGIGKISNSQSSSENNRKHISVKENVLRIGETEMQLLVSTLAQEAKVPKSLFYDMPEHVKLLESLLQDYLMGEHLLLVGNQGVGKNKLVDRLLELMRRPREYLQLHRDTTVQSLTQLSTLRDGKVVFEDSPLVTAVKFGHVLVIDEADKAPVNVTCVLRSLVESSETVLSDGRRIVSHGFSGMASNVIEMHANFRLIVLGNRPGFPFMGNDFLSALGDIFSCHAIDNPSPSSEMFLLQQYGPNVPMQILTKLVNGFGELRRLADEGVLNYPYSTREVVNIVKHLQRYPEENLSEVMRNVLDFDQYQTETLELINKVLSKHDLPIKRHLKNKKQISSQQKHLELSINYQKDVRVSGPKFGKLDLKNNPHVGGNTWAGGTGGRDTAGLGGKGGPFRLDSGHSVSQLSDEQKDNISEEIKRRAREINRKAYEDKLQEIKMSDFDHKLYKQFSQPNHQQVQHLRTILEALQNKNKERQWHKYQVHGELDDTRLIEGVTGEKNIFKRRAVASSWTSQFNNKPNRLKLVVDVSGSMYRFNGYDGRLDRQLEAVVMVMEAFEGFEEKILYDVVGHSGESWELPFINVGDVPKNDKERFEIIRMMHAHSQFCWSGDSTVKAAREACLKMSTELDYDNGIVVILSDANLDRYDISPKDLAQALKCGEPKVKGFVIFIGSLAEEADNIKREMSSGQSYICMDITTLPQILKQIFTSALL